MKKRLVLAALMATIGAFVLVPSVYAFWPLDIFKGDGEPADRHSTMISRLVERFNLDQGEVEQFFDEVHQERQVEMRTRLEEKLNQVVSEGKISSEQKDKILAKHDELKEKHQDLINLSPEERQEKMKEIHDELQQWAEENDIDMSWFFNGWGRGFKKGFRAGWWTAKQQ